MKKKWFIALSMITASFTIMGSSAFGEEALKRVVDDNELETSTLGAKVGWNREIQTVGVDLPQTTSMQRRLELLEQALAPVTSDDAVQAWARGVKTRNGALQYAVYSPDLRKSKYDALEAMNWITGTSSPWVQDYKISPGVKNGDGSYTYQIQFDWRTSDDMNKTVNWTKITPIRVVVKKYGDHWLMSDISDM